MNLFCYSSDPWESALWLDDLRKNKMILEAAQMLSASMVLNGNPTNLKVYRATHTGHPCTKWVGKSRANFSWCVDWMEALHKQRDRPHKSADLIPAFRKYIPIGDFLKEDMTPFANCARNKERGLDFTHLETHEAYREYHCATWPIDKAIPTWYHGEQPTWYKKDF